MWRERSGKYIKGVIIISFFSILLWSSSCLHNIHGGSTFDTCPTSKAAYPSASIYGLSWSFQFCYSSSCTYFWQFSHDPYVGKHMVSMTRFLPHFFLNWSFHLLSSLLRRSGSESSLQAWLSTAFGSQYLGYMRFLSIRACSWRN